MICKLYFHKSIKMRAVLCNMQTWLWVGSSHLVWKGPRLEIKIEDWSVIPTVSRSWNWKSRDDRENECWLRKGGWSPSLGAPTARGWGARTRKEVGRSSQRGRRKTQESGVQELRAEEGKRKVWGVRLKVEEGRWRADPRIEWMCGSQGPRQGQGRQAVGVSVRGESSRLQIKWE